MSDASIKAGYESRKVNIGRRRCVKVRSKEHYTLEVRLGTSPSILRSIVVASLLPLAAATSSDSNSLRWAIDMRVPLSEGGSLRAVAVELAAVLANYGISQIAGAGFGAFFLVAGIVALNVDVSGGLIRSLRKDRGFHKRIEGRLSRQRPMFIIDDTLASGESALQAAAVLWSEGYSPTGVLTVLRYGWERGDCKLREAGLISESLATLYSLYS